MELPLNKVFFFFSVHNSLSNFANQRFSRLTSLFDFQIYNMSDLEKEVVADQTEQKVTDSNNDSNNVVEDSTEVDKVKIE